MNKLILICLLFVVPTAFATTCANSDLATEVGLDALTDSVTSTATLCPGLKDGDVCCSVATINSFQALITAAVTETVLEAAARDSYLLVARAAVSPLSSTFKTLQTTALTVAGKLKTGQTGDATDAQKKIYKDFEEALEGGITTIYDMVEEGVAAEDNWSKYQAARATCANKVFEAQATVLCLACRVDPEDYATFASGQLTYADAYETALSAACYPYLMTYAPKQNAISYPYAILENLSDLNTLVTSANTDITKLTATSVTSLKSLVAKPTADYQETPETLTTCTSAADCEYSYTTLLTNGVSLVPEYLANGGTITVTASSSSRLLGEARTLAADFDPTSDDNASGVTVDFPEDVIAAASAWRQGGLMTCVVALVAMLLF